MTEGNRNMALRTLIRLPRTQLRILKWAKSKHLRSIYLTIFTATAAQKFEI